jgi:pyrroloquinoline quinone (PQQ) biosynthesis protein C
MDFRDQLRQAGQAKSMAENPLIHRLSEPGVSPALLRSFGVLMYRGADIFVLKLAKLLAITPEWTVRAALMENLIEEEGLVVRGRHVEGNAAGRHVTWARDLAVAMGATQDDLSGPPLPLPKYYEDLISRGRWLAAASYLLVGQEGNFPGTIELLLPPLRKLGYSSHDLRYLSLHHELDGAHADAGVDLVSEWARSDEEQAEALVAAERGAKEWWASFVVLARTGRPAPAMAG